MMKANVPAEYTDTFEFDKIIDPPPGNKKKGYFFPARLLAADPESEILRSPFIASLVQCKWKYMRVIFFLWLLWYILYLTLLVTLVQHEKVQDIKAFNQLNASNYTINGTSRQKHIDKMLPLSYLIRIMSFIIKEILEMYFITPKVYFLSKEVFYNVIDVALYLCAIVFALKCILNDTDSKWQTGSMAILLAWGNLLLYLKNIAGRPRAPEGKFEIELCGYSTTTYGGQLFERCTTECRKHCNFAFYRSSCVGLFIDRQPTIPIHSRIS